MHQSRVIHLPSYSSMSLDISTASAAVAGDREIVHESAAQHMLRDLPTATEFATVAQVCDYLQGDNFEAIDTLYVVDGHSHFAGIVPFNRLLTAAPSQTIGELMSLDIPTVLPETDQEHVASLALEYSLTSIPVVDGENRLLGIVPSTTLLHILRHEHIEDMNRLVGIVKNGDQARDAIEGAVWRRVVHRLPWLLVGLGGSMAATWLMSGFEQALEAQIAIAFFVPAVVYLADAIGTQTEAVAVRGLTFSTASLAALLKGELFTGSLIGLLLATAIFPMVFLVFGDAKLALAVSTAVLVAGACATSVGLLLPWLLSRLNKDPAFGSGPVATIVQDLLSLLTYFAMTWLFVM
jgi:magnesium transporter